MRLPIPTTDGPAVHVAKSRLLGEHAVRRSSTAIVCLDFSSLDRPDEIFPASFMDPDPPVQAVAPPSTWRWVIGFLLVGAAWGLTTPFMRKAALQKDKEQTTTPPGREFLQDSRTPWLKRKFWTLAYAVMDLLRRPAYAVPLLINLTGSVWFFLLIGQAGMCGHMQYL